LRRPGWKILGFYKKKNKVRPITETKPHRGRLPRPKIVRRPKIPKPKKEQTIAFLLPAPVVTKMGVPRRPRKGIPLRIDRVVRRKFEEWKRKYDQKKLLGKKPKMLPIGALERYYMSRKAVFVA
jgi:hypothetical protein